MIRDETYRVSRLFRLRKDALNSQKLEIREVVLGTIEQRSHTRQTYLPSVFSINSKVFKGFQTSHAGDSRAFYHVRHIFLNPPIFLNYFSDFSMIFYEFCNV